MTRRARLAALAGLFLIAAVGISLDGQHTASTPAPTAEPEPPPAAPPAEAPRLTREQINRQDRISPGQRRRELRELKSRPLIAILPIELAGVRIDIAGLAANGRTTVLEVKPGRRGRAYARKLYRRALAAYHDPGTAYAIRWVMP